MRKHYVVMHKAKIDREKLQSFATRKERLDFMSVEHGILKQQIKDKLAALSSLDSEYEVVSDDLVIIPAILVFCNEEMKSALESDTDLTVEENTAKFAIC